MSRQQDYYSSVYSVALAEARRRGYSDTQANNLAHTAAAQSSVETGYGNSTMDGRNFFGIKQAGTNASGINYMTREGRRGERRESQTFANFGGGLEGSVSGYFDFIENNPRYRRAGIFDASSPEEALQRMGSSGYAEDANYGRTIASVYSNYGGSPNTAGGQRVATNQTSGGQTVVTAQTPGGQSDYEPGVLDYAKATGWAAMSAGGFAIAGRAAGMGSLMGGSNSNSVPITFGNIAGGTINNQSIGSSTTPVIQTGGAPTSKGSGRSRGINKADVLEKEGDNLNDVENILIDIREEIKTLVSQNKVVQQEVSKSKSQDEIKQGFFSSKVAPAAQTGAKYGLGAMALGVAGLGAMTAYLGGGSSLIARPDENGVRTLSDGTTITPNDEGYLIRREDGTEAQIPREGFDMTLSDEAAIANIASRVPGFNRVAGSAVNGLAGLANRGIEEIATNPRTNSAVTQALEPIIRRKIASKTGQLVAKSIPVAGALIGLGQGIYRALNGDFLGAGISAASGLAGPITAIAATATDVAKEIYDEVYAREGVPSALQSDMVENPALALRRLLELTNLTKQMLVDSVMGNSRVQSAGKEGYENLRQTGTIQDAPFWGTGDNLADDLSGASTENLADAFDYAINNPGNLDRNEQGRILNELDNRAVASGDPVLMEQVRGKRELFASQLESEMDRSGRGGNSARKRLEPTSTQNQNRLRELEQMSDTSPSPPPVVINQQAAATPMAQSEPPPVFVNVTIGDDMLPGISPMANA